MSDLDLITFKQETLDKEQIGIKLDIKEIKQILNRMEAKLQLIPDNGLNCPVHDIRMQEYNKRLEVVENKLENVHTKIISWSAVASVILFLISSFAVPYIQKHMGEAPHTHEVPVKTSQWLGYPFPSPMPFLISSNLNDLVKK